jgi:hypothetical protein
MYPQTESGRAGVGETMSAVRRLAGLAVLVAVLLPAATAAPATVSQAQLALMPLPLAAYGTLAGRLPLGSDSGIDTNAVAASNANQTVTGVGLTKLGRVSGYDLDYGGLPSGARVFDVESHVDLYKTPPQAVAGLAFWRKDETAQPPPAASGISIAAKFYPVPGFGRHSFAYGGKGTVTGVAPFYEYDVYFVEGDIVAETSAAATEPNLPRPLALAAARKLRVRIAAVLAGRVQGRPVRLPVTSLTTAGPPPGGPNLASLALTTGNLGSGKIESQGYQPNPTFGPISSYRRTLTPGGPFAYLAETVSSYSAAEQATWVLTVMEGVFALGPSWKDVVGPDFKSFAPARVKLSAGDEARSVLGVATLKDGRKFDLTFVGVRKGRTLITIIAATPVGAKLLPSGVKELATIATNRASSPHATPHKSSGLTA